MISTVRAASWTCPWCERLVPSRETKCHCGCDRAVAEAKVATDAAASEGFGGGHAMLALLLVGMCGFIFYTALRHRMEAEDAAAAARERRGNPDVPASGRAGASPDTAAALLPPGYTPPAGWMSPPPRTLTPAAMPLSSPKAPEGSPTRSSMEEEWEKASALLDPPLQKIAAGSGALQASYQQFASQCLAPNAAGSGPWLETMRNAPLRGGIQVVEGGLDCQAARETLMGRANQLRSELSAASDTARTNRVLPGHWRKLVAAHQLEAWEQF
jgi:hypothetical protein